MKQVIVTKSVSFCPDAKIRPLLHVDDYTDDEFRNCWYSPDEFDIIMDDICDTIELVQRYGLEMMMIDGGNRYCLRGLEAMMTLDGEDYVLRIKENARDAVLDKQLFLLEQLDDDDGEEDRGVRTNRDDKIISEFYKQYTEQSINVAYLMGLSDATIVSSLWKANHHHHDETRTSSTSENHCVRRIKNDSHRLPRQILSPVAV